MNWTPLKLRTHFSLLKSVTRVEDLIAKVVEYGYKSIAITELGNLFSCVKMQKACKDKGIKLILGCDFYIKSEDKTLSNLTVLVKNKDGWLALLKATAEANKPENYNLEQEVATITLEKLGVILKDTCVVYSGCLYSHLGKYLFTDFHKAIEANSYEEAKATVRPDWKEYYSSQIEIYQRLFGKDNFYLEIQNSEKESIFCTQILTKLNRDIAKKLGIKKIATSKTHYLNREDSEDHRIFICSDNESTLAEVEKKLIQKKDYESLTFFKNSSAYLPNLNEITNDHTDEIDEIETTQEIADKCEDYSILGEIKVPIFKCPDNLSAKDYLRQLTVEGWKKKIINKIKKDEHQKYGDRVKLELGVINDAELQTYFLVVQDITNWAKGKGWLVGPGRGSAAGSLVSFLLSITEINPLPYNLLFERFYSAARKGQWPDIDLDFPIERREEVLEYIREKYGRDKVAQICTFGRLQGREAVKCVFRAKQRCSFAEMNRITEWIPDEAKIQDKLQEYRDEGEEISIIEWALINHKDKFKEWVERKEDGSLIGEYAIDFAQAIRLEGLKRSQGKHAAGIVIASDNLDTFCPLLYDRSTGEHLIAVEMGDCEALGGLKLDVLGIAGLGHINSMMDIINNMELNVQ